MGMYCCCGVKITSHPYKCECDWDGWVTFKDDKTPLEQPKKDGKYLVRYSDNGGDRYEDEWSYSVKCIEKHPLMYSDGFFEKHWENEQWDGNHVYAWKEKIEDK